MEDLPDVVQILEEDPKFTARDAILLALKGNVRIYCDDLSFKYYGWKYMAHKGDYGLKPEKRFPKGKNPRMTGACCKHLLSVFATMPFDWERIVRDFRKKGIIPKYRRRKKFKH